MLFASVQNIKDGDPKWHHIGGIYLHGKLEDHFGYDLVAVSADGLEEFSSAIKEGCDGIECQVDGYPGKALLFGWMSGQDHFPSDIQRGLIVDADDAEFVKDAREKFAKRVANCK